MAELKKKSINTFITQFNSPQIFINCGIKGEKRILSINHQLKMEEEIWDSTLDHYFLKKYI